MIHPALLVLSLLLLPPQDAPAPADLQRWIEELGDDELAARDRAFQALVGAGPAALEALKGRLAHVSEEEIRSRIEQAIRAIEDEITRKTYKPGDPVCGLQALLSVDDPGAFDYGAAAGFQLKVVNVSAAPVRFQPFPADLDLNLPGYYLGRSHAHASLQVRRRSGPDVVNAGHLSTSDAKGAPEDPAIDLAPGCSWTLRIREASLGRLLPGDYELLLHHKSASRRLLAAAPVDLQSNPVPFTVRIPSPAQIEAWILELRSPATLEGAVHRLLTAGGLEALEPLKKAASQGEYAHAIDRIRKAIRDIETHVAKTTYKPGEAHAGMKVVVVPPTAPLAADRPSSFELRLVNVSDKVIRISVPDLIAFTLPRYELAHGGWHHVMIDVRQTSGGPAGGKLRIPRHRAKAVEPEKRDLLPGEAWTTTFEIGGAGEERELLPGGYEVQATFRADRLTEVGLIPLESPAVPFTVVDWLADAAERHKDDPVTPSTPELLSEWIAKAAASDVDAVRLVRAGTPAIEPLKAAASAAGETARRRLLWMIRRIEREALRAGYKPGDPVSGLKATLACDREVLPPGESITGTIEVTNVGDQPIRFTPAKELEVSLPDSSTDYSAAHGKIVVNRLSGESPDWMSFGAAGTRDPPSRAAIDLAPGASWSRTFRVPADFAGEFEISFIYYSEERRLILDAPVDLRSNAVKFSVKE